MENKGKEMKGIVDTRIDFKYLPLEITLTALKRAQLPSYLGSTLRGVLGQILYQTDQEAYRYLYANGMKAGGQQNSVKPYILEPPELCTGKRIIEEGEKLSFNLLLLGDTTKYSYSIIRALEKIEQYGLGACRYPFRLLQVMHRKEQRLLWREGNYYPMGKQEVGIPDRTLLEVEGAGIRFCTPLRIRRGGKLLTDISFAVLIRNITNRVVALTERYGGWVDQEVVAKLQELSLEIKTVKESLKIEELDRYSNRLQEKMNFSGLLGEMEFAGDLTPFVPWLYVAEILHIGRNTTFGMGKVQVYFI